MGDLGDRRPVDHRNPVSGRRRLERRSRRGRLVGTSERSSSLCGGTLSSSRTLGLSAFSSSRTPSRRRTLSLNTLSLNARGHSALSLSTLSHGALSYGDPPGLRRALSHSYSLGGGLNPLRVTRCGLLGRTGAELLDRRRT